MLQPTSRAAYSSRRAAALAGNAHPAGDAELRRQIAGMIGDGADPEREITITAGATEARFVGLLATSTRTTRSSSSPPAANNSPPVMADTVPARAAVS